MDHVTYNSPTQVMDAYHAGQINESQCWEALAHLQTYNPKQPRQMTLKTPPGKQPAEPLNRFELQIIKKMQRVSFGMARAARGFIHQIKNEHQLTPRQREYLRLLVYRYRRQLWTHLTDEKADMFISQMKSG